MTIKNNIVLYIYLGLLCSHINLCVSSQHLDAIEAEVIREDIFQGAPKSKGVQAEVLNANPHTDPRSYVRPKRNNFEYGEFLRNTLKRFFMLSVVKQVYSTGFNLGLIPLMPGLLKELVSVTVLVCGTIFIFQEAIAAAYKLFPYKIANKPAPSEQAPTHTDYKANGQSQYLVLGILAGVIIATVITMIVFSGD